jgi:hypothetical protein
VAKLDVTLQLSHYGRAAILEVVGSAIFHQNASRFARPGVEAEKRLVKIRPAPWVE